MFFWLDIRVIDDVAVCIILNFINYLWKVVFTEEEVAGFISELEDIVRKQSILASINQKSLFDERMGSVSHQCGKFIPNIVYCHKSEISVRNLGVVVDDQSFAEVKQVCCKYRLHS